MFLLIYPLIILLLINIFIFLKDRRILINGFIFFTVIVIFAGICISYADKSIIILIIGIFISILLFIMYINFLWWLIPVIVMNSIKLIKKEGRTFSNSLSLLFILSLIMFSFVITLTNKFQVIELQIISIGLTFMYLYFMVHIISFINTYLLLKLPINKKPDFIVVLGSGLINDTVPPLLASRIDKGIEIYHKFKDKKDLKLVFSGGQGQDENIPEGKAMANYARSKGIDEAVIIEETESLNTYENILYSKNKMDKESSHYFSIFVTNNFHILRAGLLAKRIGLKMYGVGSKTKLYFWINAMVREYIAVLSMNKKRHIIIITIDIIFMLLALIISFIYRIV